tara:strand:- start:734 stop:1123 length:390 start_codon:yes stop_codon:yes gene_type:complete
MSTLEVSNLNDGTTTLGTTYITNGSAKAWNSFNGTGTVAIRDSFNTSSITDRGTGAYTNNLTSAMGNANYSYTGLSSRSSSASQVGIFCGNSSDSSAPTASAAQVNELASSSSFFDVDLISNTFHGDLA